MKKVAVDWEKAGDQLVTRLGLSGLKISSLGLGLEEEEEEEEGGGLWEWEHKREEDVVFPCKIVVYRVETNIMYQDIVYRVETNIKIRG